jgi:hypothetical protein
MKRKLLVSCSAFLVMVLVLSGCLFSTKMVLNVEVEGEGTVKLNPEPEAGGYKKDTIVELQSIPADNWKFAHWTGDIDGNSQVITVKMDSPKNIKAVFSKDTHFIYVIVQGNGKVEETVLAGRGVYE